MSRRVAPLLLLATVGACAVQKSEVARQAQSSLVGTSQADLDLCAGLPTKSERLNPATEMRSYEYAPTSADGVNLTLPIVGGGINLADNGYCHATFEMVNGRVAAVRYAGDTSLPGGPEAMCAPIVQHCMAAKRETGAAR